MSRIIAIGFFLMVAGGMLIFYFLHSQAADPPPAVHYDPPQIETKSAPDFKTGINEDKERSVPVPRQIDGSRRPPQF